MRGKRWVGPQRTETIKRVAIEDAVPLLRILDGDLCVLPGAIPWKLVDILIQLTGVLQVCGLRLPLL